MCCAQPFDAAAAVLDGSLLGASETAWVSRSALLVSASVVLAMFTTKRLHGSLVFVWCAAAHALRCMRPMQRWVALQNVQIMMRLLLSC